MGFSDLSLGDEVAKVGHMAEAFPRGYTDILPRREHHCTPKVFALALPCHIILPLPPGVYSGSSEVGG